MKINPKDASHFKFINYTSDSNGGYPSCLTTAVPTTADASTKAYAWAFVGDLYNGFKLYNRAAGGDFALYSSGSEYTTMTAEGTIFQMVASQQTNAENGTLFSLKTPYGNYLNKGANDNRLGHWVENDGGSTLILSAFEEPDLVSAKETAWAEMMAKINTLGNTLGTYSYKVGNKKLYTIDALRIALRDAYTDAEITALLDSYTLNMPETGKFYYIQSANTNQYLSNIKSNTNPKTLTTTEQQSANNIFYFESEGDNTYLVAYENGHYVTNPWNIGVGEEKINENEIYKQTKSFVEGQIGKYALKYFASDGRMHYFTASGTSTNENTDKGIVQAQWNLEAVTSLPFTFKKAALGFATFNAPVPVELPEGVIAYVAQIVGESTLKMRKFISEPGELVVVPANTPVMLYKENLTADTQISLEIEEDTYSEEELAEIRAKNSFFGTVAAKTYPTTGETVYSLQKNSTSTMVGFYQKSSETTLGGFKAWIKTATSNARAFTIIFDGDDATGLKEALGLENENVEIYDLSGRRLDKPAKGVNVIGGKLVIK